MSIDINKRICFQTILIVTMIAVAILFIWVSPEHIYKLILKKWPTADSFYKFTIGLAALIGVPFLIRRSNAAKAQADAALEQAKTAESGHITDRFSKAVELLGSDKLEERIGGIFALERIAKDSEKDHWVIMEVLTAFVRANTKAIFDPILEERLNTVSHMATLCPIDGITGVDPERKITKTDIQTVLTVIGRRKRGSDPIGSVIDLSRTDLSDLNITDLNLEGVNLTSAYLVRIKNNGINTNTLIRTNLSNANLTSANLSYANLSCTNLEESQFLCADLRGAELGSVKASKTIFDSAIMIDVHLTNACITGAIFNRANLNCARMGINGTDANDASFFSTAVSRMKCNGFV